MGTHYLPMSRTPLPTPTPRAGKRASKPRKRAGADSDECDDTGDQGPAGGAGGFGGGAGGWDWEWGRGAVLGALRQALGADLRALYGGVEGVERMAGLALDMVGPGAGKRSGHGARPQHGRHLVPRSCALRRAVCRRRAPCCRHVHTPMHI